MDFFEPRESKEQNFVKKLSMHFSMKPRWIFIPKKCVFDETKFCIYLRKGVVDGKEATKKEVH